MSTGKEQINLFSNVAKSDVTNGGFSLKTTNRTNEQPLPTLNYSGWDVVRDFTKPNFHSLEKYLNYTERIATFTTWPKAMPITSMELAHAGFIYTGFADKVHCPWCKLTLHEFDERDSPYEEHLKHTRGCGYLRMTLPNTTSDLSRSFRSKLFTSN